MSLENLFWDSCIFMRYITAQPEAFVSDIGGFIKDAQKGQRKIYFSTIAFAEIRPSALRARSVGSIHDFFRELGTSFIPVDAGPNVMITAGAIRDVPTTNPYPKAETTRVVGMGDSIQLATCLYVRDVLEVKDVVFHTLDEGKGHNWEGRCVPLLKFEDWYADGEKGGVIGQICDLPRLKPLHPQPDMFSPGPAADAPLISHRRH